jgi:hypothetical protein
VFLAKSNDSTSGEDDQYINLGESRYFVNCIDWHANFIEHIFQFNYVLLSGKEEYKVREKGNVLLQRRR